ncbi:histidine kinase [Novosphingobium gossypii]|uniref:sensor histidine kinase n=1 Tax=Novosphingobium gossypii TaxID=1604774 RepID=UPI003D1F8D42
MHFDDRLATVLRLPPSGGALARVQFRQLVDILGHAPESAANDADDAARSDSTEAAFARLAQLGRVIPPADRARLLRTPLQPMTNPRLLAWLAEAEPDVACAGIAAAQLDDAGWLSLIPRLPVRARGILRHRRDLSPAVEALLDRLGVQDRALPPGGTFDAEPDTAAQPESAPAPVLQSDWPEPDPEDSIPEPSPARLRKPTGDIAVDQDISPDVLDLLNMADDPLPPTSLSEWARARAGQHRFSSAAPVAAPTPVPAPAPMVTPPRDAGIGAIVRRIEEFRKAREARTHVEAHTAASRFDSPRLPLGDVLPATQRLATSIDFTTDTRGIIDWADGPDAPSIAGLDIAGQQPAGTHDDPGFGDLAHALRQRLPLRGRHINITGAPAVSGLWQVDAAPRFTHGRFVGYCGRLRRPACPTPAEIAKDSGHAEADRMREVLHELRTPANAIQVAAEIIQQQLYGPAPHEYRALAAAIAGDCAHILAGFEELDRLVRLESGALALEEGECDLARVLAQTIVRLHAWTGPRGSGFALAADPSASTLPVNNARADVERMVWRLFAALAGSTAPGEMLDLGWVECGALVELTVALPALLAEREGDALFDTAPAERGQSLAAGMFGIGFTLRLATAEAAAAGGSLVRVDNALVLSLPASGMEKTTDTTNSSAFSQ